MPIISTVGARSTKVRLLYALIFAVLSLGALTMLYPFSLMLTGSVKSEADDAQVTAYPRYWFDDASLFAKYAESKYHVDLSTIARQWREDISSWLRVVPPPELDARQRRILDAYLEFREEFYANHPEAQWWWFLGHLRGGRMLLHNGRLFREAMYDRFDGDLDKLRLEMALPLKDWNVVQPPGWPQTRLNNLHNPYQRAQYDFALTRPHVERIIFNTDGWFFRSVLLPKYGRNIEGYNALHGTSHKSYQDVFLATRAPAVNPAAMRDWNNLVKRGHDVDAAAAAAPGTQPTARMFPAEDKDRVPLFRQYLKEVHGSIEAVNRAWETDYREFEQVGAPGLERKDWEEYVRKSLMLEFVRLDSSAAPAWRRFLEHFYSRGDAGEGATGIERYNKKFGTSYRSFDEVPFPASVPRPPAEQLEFDRFLKDVVALPAEAITVHGPRQEFELFYARKLNLPVEDVAPLALPVKAADWEDMKANSGGLRWEFATRNYKHVLGYLALHGNGVLNTLIYCVMAIGAALVVNPLAAYALSRYKLPSTYTILLFCMATMAFPGEVTMIPAFLLLKRFPLYPILSGAAAFVVVLIILNRVRPKWDELLRMLIALAAAIFVGAWLLPAITSRPNVSLLNTFAALVLPHMANGFSIFLLKGFFDSLPAELYEAADIDGASEWTKFWTITMSLSKPILAVIALGAFTHAYSAFMMALIIIPDQKMWTIMVWLFQLQQTSHQSVVYASLVIAAIPTFLVFAFCQNLIMRGIVVPVEK